MPVARPWVGLAQTMRRLAPRRTAIRLLSGSAPMRSPKPGLAPTSRPESRFGCWRNRREKFELVLRGVATAQRLGKFFAVRVNANRSRKVKRHLCLVSCALAGIAILHCSALAETAKPDSAATVPAPMPTPHKTNGQSSKTVEDCLEEWRADREAMMKRDMTEESYVEQCSAKDDVPPIPAEPKTNAAPSTAPDRSAGR